uniref:Enhancer of polycomb-like protein n=1 Tax=Glossina morsitans morsitans TaxID=37546 RepID=A0A1B0G767_GLOMM
MSKLSFRARALDPSKQMPIFLAEELPDLPEYSAINRAVPQMPSGMEKEEESEHHLQRAICTGLIIPTPEVYSTEAEFYDKSYPPNFRMPRQLIHMQPLGLEQDVPEYDMDSDDELWIDLQRKRLDLTPLKFEQMMDRLEKSSGQTVVTLNEAKALLKQDDEVSIAVYDYWLNKRLKMKNPLILTVKTENRPGTSSNNPYLAFRRRTEKMQTRKNRKNDETSYEKMLKLRRDLQRATTVLEMVKRREKTKREQLHLSIEIFEKRVQLKDFSGALLSELSATLKNTRPAFAPLYANQYSHHHHSSSSGGTPTAVVPGASSSAAGLCNVMGSSGGLLTSVSNVSVGGGGGASHLYSSASQYLNSANIAMDALNTGSRKEKRQYKKRKHKIPRDKQQLQQQQQYLAGIGVMPASASSTAGGLVGSTSMTGSAVHHHHHHLPHHLHPLHRQSSSPAPNESNIETEEEDLAHKVGSESEEEAPFAFRRKQGCDYLRTRTRTGNWPWEPKEEDGYGDNKYRFTLTSIRHPRARCIGFARRRLGRGGRVLLDRVATNFDDFWSQLDYTILETPHTLNENANKAALKKPASPPTVVDLPRSAFATGVGSLLNSCSVTPAIEIKKEVNEVGVIDNADNRKQTQGSIDYAYFSENKIERKNEERNEMETDQRDGFQISRDTRYQSYLSVSQAEPGQRKLPSSAFEPDGKEQQQTVMKLMQRRLLLKLSKSLNVDANSTSDKDSIKTSVVCPNNTISCQLQSHSEIKQENVNSDKGENVEQHTSLNTISHRINNTLVTLVGEVHVNSINHNHIGSSSINSSNNFNNRTLSCSGRISNLSDKYNVIKTEASPSLEATMASSVQLLDPSERKFIKQEQIDMTVSLASADDSNEPLSSIQKMTCGSISSHTDIMEDEENVNLAQLSNLIKHTVKKEISEEGQYSSSANVESIYKSKQTLRENDLLATFTKLDEEDGVCSLNQMPDVVRVENMKRPRVRKVRTNSAVGLNSVNLLIEDVGAVNNTSDQEEEMAMMGSLSPSSSQRLDVCNELLSEIRRDWVHFRPKTPTETEKQDACSLDLEEKVQARVPLVSWSQQSPIAVEMLREPLECRKHTEDEKSIWKAGVDKDSLFITSSFKYDDLEPDAQLLPHSYIADFARSDSKSPEVQSHQTNACLDFNLSGDSLNDINLLGDGDDADMLDNILQEVQIDDIKTLNQATNFWNGILDGEAVDAEVVGDVETAAGLLDGIDEAKKSGDKSSSGGKRCQHNKGKAGKRSCALLMPVGCSSFTTTALNNETLRDDCFFHKEQTKTKAPAIDDVIPEEIVEIKPEPKEVKVEAVVTNSNNFPTLPPLPPPPTLVPQPMLRPALGMTTTTATTMPSSAPVLNINQNKGNEPTIEHHTGIVVQQQQLRLPQQQQQHHHQYLGSQPAMAAPLTIASTAVTLATTNPSVQQAHQQQFTTSAATIQVLQQQQPAAQQIRNVTIQQLHQLQLQQQRKIQLQQQQHQKLLMQRDTSVLAQYVPSSAHNATTTSSPTPTMLRQPSLTPIGTTSVANSGTAGQMIYTTTSSGEVIAAAGSPKIYLQKASASGATSHSQVNIINTSSGQLTVQNIANVQQLTASGSGTNTSGGGSLIVATATRNAVQQLAQQQQQQLVNQPIVWRQIGSTNVTTAPAGIMAATASTSTDGSDISKLLLNRKLSQRKIVAQQQQQLQDDDLAVNVLSSVAEAVAPTTTNVTYASNQQQQQPQQRQHQLHKVQGGKLIKMPSFPLLVSEVNLQQQQQQQLQQKHNSAAAAIAAANHNYSLQPTAIITSQSSQQGNKIYLTSSSSSNVNAAAPTNFTITNASDLHTAAQKLQQGNHLPTSATNLKLNFVTTASVAQQQQHQQQHQTPLTVGQQLVLNKSTMQQQQQQLLQHQLLQQSGKLKRERILNIIGATPASSMDVNNTTATTTGVVAGNTAEGSSKRVLYTSLLNVKPLQKNNAGQMQVQIGPQGMAHALLRGRIANNQAIFTNMRTLPIAVSTGGSAVVNSTPSGSANNIQVLSGSGSSNNLSNNCTSSGGVVNNSSHTLSTENSANNQDMLMNNNSATVGSPASVLSTVSAVGGKDVKSVVVELTASGNANNGPCMANNNNAANGNSILTSSSSSSISITNNNSNGNSGNSNNSNATASMLTTNNTTINR